jgi:glycosyltransferase involved in cell wall biosynthesis
LRIAFAKPDHGIAGGLEAVVAELEAIARRDGHEVRRVSIDMRPPRAAVAGLDIPRHVWDAAPEYFGYLGGLDGFARQELGQFDLVVSSQPPSFAIRHPRHLSVFYHHHRVYYDLLETYLAAGYAQDEALHRAAGERIRAIDAPHLDEVGWFLAGSATVADRLAAFGGHTNTSVFHAGCIVGPQTEGDGPEPSSDGAVLTVGRLEFPKRTELTIAAAHLLPHRRFAIVGTGGRDGWCRSLDQRFALGELDAATATPAQTWCTTGRGADPSDADAPTTNVELAGRVSDADLAERFAAAPCVVAPAYDEDYGLTAIEAMAQGKPVIVCADGGGLVELVDHEQTGLVVEPTPQAIADAVERLCGDPDLAAELGANGRDRAAELSWAAAADEFRAGIEAVMA